MPSTGARRCSCASTACRGCTLCCLRGSLAVTCDPHTLCAWPRQGGGELLALSCAAGARVESNTACGRRHAGEQGGSATCHARVGVGAALLLPLSSARCYRCARGGEWGKSSSRRREGMERGSGVPCAPLLLACPMPRAGTPSGPRAASAASGRLPLATLFPRSGLTAPRPGRTISTRLQGLTQRGNPEVRRSVRILLYLETVLAF